MKLNKFFTAVLTLAMTMVVVSCQEKEYDYECVIPSDASAVARVNLASLAKKSDIGKSPLLAMVKASLQMMVSTQVKEKAEAIIDDPSLTGIDFSVSPYLFMVGSNNVCLSLCVDDESLLQEFMKTLQNQSFCSAIKEHDGYRWTRLMDDFGVVFSDKVMLVMAQMDEDGKGLDEKLMLSLMNLDADQSFTSTVQYQKMNELRNKDIQVYANLAAVPSELRDEYKDLMPATVKWSDMEIVTGVDFNDGNVELALKFFSKNEKIQQQLDEYYAGLKKMDGTYVDNIPTDCMAWLYAGVNGETLLTKLKEIPEVKEALIAAELGIDAEQMARAIDGDVLILYDDNDSWLGDLDFSGGDDGWDEYVPREAQELPEETKKDEYFALYAQLNNSDFMKDVDYWMESAKDFGIGINRVDDSQYVMKIDNDVIFWAVNDNELYFGSSVYAPLKRQGKNMFKSEITNSYAYLYIDLKDTKLFRSMTIWSPEAGEIDARLNSMNIAGNILKEIIKAWN